MNGELAITAKKLFVGQVHKDATEEQLMELFSKFGAVEKITLSPKSNRADSSYTFAFIRFKKWASCEAAIEALHEKYTMHGMDHPLVVKFADARKESMSHHHHQQQQHHQHVAEIKGPANSIPIQNVRQEQGGGNIIHVAANALPTNGTGLQHDPRPISNTTMRHPGPFRHMEQNGEFPLPHPFQSHPYPHQFEDFPTRGKNIP